MYKLIILCRYAALTGWSDKEFVLDTEFDTTSQAELRALRWLIYRPDDIVMLVELKKNECKHCDRPIQEKAGWVRHRWVHEGGYYACLPDGATQAEPKEEV